jgi:hypothetical protein
MRQERTHLGACQHHRQRFRAAGTRDVTEPRQLDVEHVAVEEEQRLQCLVLRRGADPALDCEVRQELLDLAGTEPARMPVPMKDDITPQPLQVGLLGPQRQMTRAHALARDRDKTLRPVNGRLRLVQPSPCTTLLRWKQIYPAERERKAACLPYFINAGRIICERR